MFAGNTIDIMMLKDDHADNSTHYFYSIPHRVARRRLSFRFARSSLAAGRDAGGGRGGGSVSVTKGYVFADTEPDTLSCLSSTVLRRNDISTTLSQHQLSV